MNTCRIWSGAITLLCIILSPSASAAGLGVNQVVEAGLTKRVFSHPEAVVLQDGFWAKTGSNVTVRTTLTFLQMSDQPHPEPIPEPNNDRSPPPLGIDECTLRICASGDLYSHKSTEEPPSVDIDIGKNANLPNPSSYYAITGIGIREGMDNPCQLSLWGTMVDPQFKNSGGARKLAVYTLDKCKTLGHIDFKEARFEAGKNRFVRALQACVKHQPNVKDVAAIVGPFGRIDIKGLRVLAGQVSAMNENVTPLSGPPKGEETFKRPNCPNVEKPAEIIYGVGSRSGWRAWSTCPEGQLATGVTAFYNNYNKGKAFSALRVKCKYVRLLPGSEPVNDSEGY